VYILALAPPTAAAVAAESRAVKALNASAELSALADARHMLLAAPIDMGMASRNKVDEIAAKVRKKNRFVALRRAAGRLAQCILRSGDYNGAATLFAESDRPLGEVFRALQAHHGATFATLRYLDSVLFNPQV